MLGNWHLSIQECGRIERSSGAQPQFPLQYFKQKFLRAKPKVKGTKPQMASTLSAECVRVLWRTYKLFMLPQMEQKKTFGLLLTIR